MKKSTFILLLLTIVLGFVLRFYKITQSPPALNWDETSIGYNAFSILKTGRDEWGKFLPLHFRAYGEYKLPVQIYASIPGIWAFGLTDFGVRITPVVYGTFTILLLYFLTKSLFASDTVSLTAAFLLAVSPWHIQLTRASFESGFSVLWVILGVFFLVKGFSKPKLWVFSSLAFIVSIYTYNSARVFTPIFLLSVFLLFRKKILTHKKEFLAAAVVFVALSLPLLPFITSGEVRARYRLVSISDDPGFVLRINEARGNTQLPEPLPRLIHNKLTHYAYVFTGNYLRHFTPDFLFIHGAGHKQHHVQGIGELYWIQAPFVLLGLYFLFRKKKKYRLMIVVWLLATFIPVSATNDSIPNALRTVIAAPVYAIISALGLGEVLLMIKKKGRLAEYLIGATAFGAFAFQFVPYLTNLYTVYPKLYSRDWQYGYKQVVSYINAHYSEYDEIIFSRTYGEPHMFSLFYLNWDPADYQNAKNLVRYQAYDWVWVLRFDKFYFPDLGDAGTKFADLIAKEKGKRLLFIGKAGDFSENVTKLMTVNFSDGSRAFEVVEVK